MKTKYVHPTCVTVGDKIAAHQTLNDTDVTVVGVVQRIENTGGLRLFYSGMNEIIFTWDRGNEKGLHVEMLDAYTPAHTKLFSDTLIQ